MTYHIRFLLKRLSFYLLVVLFATTFIRGAGDMILDIFYLRKIPANVLSIWGSILATIMVTVLITVTMLMLFRIANVHHSFLMDIYFDVYYQRQATETDNTSPSDCYRDLLHYCADKLRSGISLRHLNRAVKENYDDWQITFQKDKGIKTLVLEEIDKSGKKMLFTMPLKTSEDYRKTAKSELESAFSEYITRKDESHINDDLSSSIEFALNYIGMNDINEILNKENLNLAFKEQTSLANFLFDPPVYQLKVLQEEKILLESELYQMDDC